MKKSCLLISVLVALIASSWTHAVSIYSLNSKIYIADVSASKAFFIVERGARWDILKFEEPSVPVWVSADYLRIDGQHAVVIANRLNMRLKASIDSPVLGVVSQGYSTLVGETQNGFVRIMAPTELLVATTGTRRTSVDKTRAQSDPGRQKLLEIDQRKASQQDSKWKMSQTNSESSGVQSVGDANVQQVSNSREGELETQFVNKPATQNQPRFTPQVSDPAEYTHRLSPGDTISLQVFGEPDLSLASVRIPQSGSVSFPLIGAVLTSGKTTEEVKNIVREKLSAGYIRNPKLSISIDSYRPIFIKGAVDNIGAFPYTEGLTIAKALALAGGAKNSARENGVTISRDGTIVRAGLSLDSQYKVASGDIISVEEELGGDEGSAFYVYLHGEVRSPGEYQYRRGLTVEKAIVLAGGFSLRASRKKITVSRIIEDEEAPQKLTKVPLYLPVQPGDIVDVGASWF